MAYKAKKSNKTEKPTNDSCYSYVNNLYQDSKGDTSTWSSHQEKWQKLRMRIKKSKTFPFVGCSNIRMPTAETKIRKVKAALMNTVFGVRPVAQAIPAPGGDFNVAKKIERFLDHLIMDIMKIKPDAAIAIDQTCEKGMYLMKPYWRTTIDKREIEIKAEDLDENELLVLNDPEVPIDIKIEYAFKKFDIDESKHVYEDNYKMMEKAITKFMNGDTEVSVILQDVTYDFPDVDMISPERVFVSTDSGWNPQKAQWIIHEYFLPYHQVKFNSEYMGWDKNVVVDIKGASNSNEGDDVLSDTQKDQREGITREGDLVRIWEYYGYYDLKGTGTQDKCVITLAPDFSKVLNKSLLPFDNMKFPFVKLFYEMIDDRWFSHRGLVEIIEDIIKEIDVQHNQKIDQQTIRNAPMFVYRAGMVNPNTVQFMPNQGIPVNGMNPLRDTIDVLNNTNSQVEFSYEREQMLLETKIEELTGQVDTTLQSMINRREPRTLGEVQIQQQNMQNVFSLDASLFTEQFSELFSWIWDLWCQYGSDEYEFMYFGEEGFQPIKLTREEIQGQYKIVVRGNDQNTNPQVRLQKAQQILLATTNPVYMQSGVVTPKEMMAGLKRFYQELSIPNYEELINENVQPPQPPPPPPSASLIKPKFEDLTDSEQAQVLASANVKPDVKGRVNRKNLDLFKEATNFGNTNKR